MSTNKIAEAITELIKNGDRETLGNMLILLTEILKTNPQKKSTTQTSTDNAPNKKTERIESFQQKQTTSLFAPPTARMPSKEQQTRTRQIEESYTSAIDPLKELEEARKNLSLSDVLQNNQKDEEDVLSRSLRILG